MHGSQERARALIARLDHRAERVATAFEGARIQWRRFGTGAPLVLLHGGHGSWLHWVRNVEALAATHTLWLADLPGCGDSDELPPPASLERLVGALHAGIDTLAGAQTGIGLVAFSFGAVLASNLALARGHVTRLALFGPTGHGLPRRRLDLTNWRELPRERHDEAHAHNLSQLMLHDPASIDALALVVHREAALRTRLRSRAISHTSAMRDALDRLRVPVLMAWGEHDPTAHAPEAARVLAEGHPNRECVVVPGAGHWLQYERADLANHLLRTRFR